MKQIFPLLLMFLALNMFAQPDSWEELNPAQDNSYFPYVPNAGIFYSEHFDKVYLYDPIHYFIDEGYNEYVMSHYLVGFDGTNWEPLIETNEYQWGSIEHVVDFDEGMAFVQKGGVELGQFGYMVSYYNGNDIIELGVFEMQSPSISLTVEGNQLYLSGFFGIDENQEFNILKYSIDTSEWTDAFSSLPELDSGWPYSLIHFQEKWYLGGDFTYASQNESLFVLNDSGWEVVVNENGFSIDGRIRKLVKYQDKLALAIEILSVGNLDEGIGSGVVFWDGQNWESPQLLFGPNGTQNGVAIWDIETQGQDLYAFGTLFEAGDETMRYLSKWDGSQWCGMQTSEWELGGFEMALFQNRIIQAGFNWGTPNRVYWHDGETFSPCTTPLSVEEVSTTDVVVYPNPANEGVFTINTEQRIDHLLMFDAQGRTVLSLQPTSNTLDVNALPTGVYFLEVSFETGSVVKKVVVQ